MTVVVPLASAADEPEASALPLTCQLAAEAEAALAASSASGAARSCVGKRQALQTAGSATLRCRQRHVGPNHLANASSNATSAPSPAHATYPSGRTSADV